MELKGYPMLAAAVKVIEHFDPLPILHDNQHKRPAHLRDVDARSLSPLHRILLSTDGTVTTLLEAIALEPIEADVLERAHLDAHHLRDWIDPDASEPVERHVALRGAQSGQLYAVATSLLLHSRLGPAVVKSLRSARKGIGEALRSTRTESYRELLWYGLGASDRMLPRYFAAQFRSCLTRAYRILSKGSPIMVVQESFPLEAFTESRSEADLSSF
jgi:chorismate-pyruvate lyase